MTQLTATERRAAQEELDRSQRKITARDNRRLAAINRALTHPMPKNKRQLRAAERAFVYPQ